MRRRTREERFEIAGSSRGKTKICTNVINRATITLNWPVVFIERLPTVLIYIQRLINIAANNILCYIKRQPVSVRPVNQRGSVSYNNNLLLLYKGINATIIIQLIINSIELHFIECVFFIKFHLIKLQNCT